MIMFELWHGHAPVLDATMYVIDHDNYSTKTEMFLSSLLSLFSFFVYYMAF